MGGETLDGYRAGKIENHIDYIQPESNNKKSSEQVLVRILEEMRTMQHNGYGFTITTAFTPRVVVNLR